MRANPINWDTPPTRANGQGEPWEHGPPPGFDDDAAPASKGSTAGETPPPSRPPSPRLASILEPSLVRVQRRCDCIERPIALPWDVLAEHFGGGLWPGLHVLNSGTGVGKTQMALQIASRAAKAGIPVLYVGLELGELDLALRMLGEEAHVPWSRLWTGKAGAAYVAKAHEAATRLLDLPFHYEVARPHGLPTSELRMAVESIRALYPEADGPGSRPLLLLVDFLQLIGDEPDDEQDLRVRIGRASYALRDFANRLNIAVLCISSIARERYKICNEIHTVAELAWDKDADGCPINRRVLNTDAIVGAGKESGEIEYSADSVSVLAKVAETWAGHGCDVVFATAKGRATGAMWSPLHFTGFAFEVCEDRGGRIIEAWEEAADRRDRVQNEKRTAKEQAKADKILADAAAVARYVLGHPTCNVTEAKVNTVTDNPRRWKPAVAKLGEAALRQTKDAKDGKSIRLTLELGALPPDVRALVADAISDVGHSPPYTPPPSASAVDGLGPTTDAGPSRMSEASDVSQVGADHG